MGRLLTLKTARNADAARTRAVSKFPCLSGDWIPAFAGMTTPVVPAQAGTQGNTRLGITGKLHLPSFLPGCISQPLEVQHFGDLILGRETPLHRS